MNTQLLYLFIKDSIYYTSNHFNKINYTSTSVLLMSKFFSKPFYLLFKKISTKSFGIMTINLTKSLISKTLSDVDSLLMSKKQTKPQTQFLSSKYAMQYAAASPDAV